MSADLDRHIDRVVQEMLDAEPRADLRARAIEQIERTRRVHWEWIAAPIAAAALVLLAVMLRPAPSLQSLPIAQVVDLPRVDLPAEAGRHEPARDLPAKAGSRGTSTRAVWLPALAGRTASAGSLAGRPTIDIAPLAAPTPISVRPVQPRALDHADVAIDALPDIAPISIEPLPPGGRH